MGLGCSTPVTRQVVTTGAIRLGLTILALLTSIASARFLGQSGRGDYFFMVTLSATIVQFAALGLPASNTWLVAAARERLPSLTVNSAWIALGAAGGVGTAIAIGALVSGILQDTPQEYLWLAAALAPPSLFYLLGSVLLVGVGRIRAFNAAEIGSRVLVFCALVTAGVAGAGASGFIIASIAAWTISAIAVGISLLRRHPFSLRFDTRMLRLGLRYAFKSYIIALLAFLVLRSNIFLLRREWGPAQLGLYSVAAQIADVLAILPQTVHLILFPRLVREGGSRWPVTIRAAAGLGSAVTIMCIVTAMVAEPVIGVLFGATFEPSAQVLLLMLPGVIALSMTSVFGAYVGAIGLPRATIGIWAAALIVVVVTSLVLVPGHAGAGAALSLSIAYVVAAVGMTTLAYHHHRLFPHDDAVGPPLLDSEPLPPSSE